MHEVKRHAWRKSRYSANEVQCVEFAEHEKDCAVRDSKNPTGPVLTFSSAQWAVFTAGVKTGQFD
ncbi:MAG: DUF397 domain-containing protein [Pseudonocardiaceae bacterium]